MSKDSLPFGHGIPGQGPERRGRLQDALGAWGAEAARAEFRSDLKGQFLAGAFVDRGREASGFEAALRTQRPPAPDAGFQDRVRSEFLGGRGVVEERAVEERKPHPAIGSSQQQPSREARPSGVPRKGPGTLMNFWAPLAVAAALLVLFFGPKFWGRSNPLPAPQATAWSLPESVEELQWTIDGEPVAPSDGRDQIVQRLASAQRVGALPGGALRLAYGRLFQVEVAEGSELDLSQFRSADSAAVYRLGMLGDSGGFCFRTGPDFKRNRCELIFQTPEAEIAVVGTVFAVDRYTSEQSMAGTCVCCSEGTVQVNGTYDRKGVTEAGGSCFVVPGNKPLMEGEVQGDHLQPMLRLAEAEVPETWLD